MSEGVRDCKKFGNHCSNTADAKTNVSVFTLVPVFDFHRQYASVCFFWPRSVCFRTVYWQESGDIIH